MTTLKRIAVLTSGGDAPGMNACIRAVVRKAWQADVETIGIKEGFCGLLSGEREPLSVRSVANIIQRGGTILQSSRSDEFKTPEARRRAAENLRRWEIDGLVAVGGGGTFQGLAALSEETGIGGIGVPATIDNDVYGTDYTIGFDTAINTALDAIDRLRDTAASHARLFFVEVMGRTTGFIAAEVGLAGGAEEVLVPERLTDIGALCERLEASAARGKLSSIVVVAEGEEPGGTLKIAAEVQKCLEWDFRVAVLGHIQRGGKPTARDRVLASKLGAAAVDGLLADRAGTMVGEVRGEIVYSLLRETWERKKQPNPALLDLVHDLAG